MTTQITDHAGEARARLLEQFQGKANIEALLDALMVPVQACETALYALLTERDVDTAIGAQLDDLGTIVGQARGGLGDDDYRRIVRARIRANRSNASIEDLIAVTRLVLDVDSGVAVTPSGTATVRVTYLGSSTTYTVAELLDGLLRRAVAAGVRLDTVTAAAAPTAVYTLDSAATAQALDNGVMATIQGP